MTPKDLECKLFCEGCTIEAEINLEDRTKVRLISTTKGEKYKLFYRRNEHNVFIVNQVNKL